MRTSTILKLLDFLFASVLVLHAFFVTWYYCGKDYHIKTYNHLPRALHEPTV